MGNAVRTRHVSCRHTLWRARWPARPWPPTIWGTWDLCWTHLCLRRPTQCAPSQRWTRRTWLRTAASLRSMVAMMTTLLKRRRRITTSWLCHPNVWPRTCPSRSPSLCMPKPSCACCSSGLTCWASTRTTDAGNHYIWTLIGITWAWAGTVFMTASGWSTNAPSVSTFMSGSPARPVMCTGPSSWTSWHTWVPVLRVA